MNKVLTLRASSIGDALMGKYFLENVHAAYREAACYMLVGSRGEMIRDLLAGYPWIGVIEASRRHPRSLANAWRALRGSDIALTQYSEKPFSAPSKIFARFASKYLIGFEDSWWGNRFLYNALVPWSGEANSNGMIVEEQRALAEAGVPTNVSELSLSYVSDPSFLPRSHLSRNEYVVAHLFSGNEGRSISQKKRMEIVRALQKVMPHTIVLTGGESDVARSEEATQRLSQVLSRAGKTSMQELVNLIAYSRGVLSLDTGAAHIAAHLKRPLVVLTRKEAREAWWGSPMYQNRPVVLCNDLADDDALRVTPHPPSLETIDTHIIADTVARCVA